MQTEHEILAVRIPAELKRTIERVAASQDRTPSQAVRRVLRESFAPEAEQNAH